VPVDSRVARRESLHLALSPLSQEGSLDAKIALAGARYLEDRRPGAARAAAVAVLGEDGGESMVLAAPGEVAAFTADAPFLIYSLTKSYLAAAALRLCDRGELELDAPITRWLPQAPHARRITTRQLLHHRSGLPDYGGLAEYHQAVRRGGEPWSDAEFLERAGAGQLRFAPGEGWAYSNLGYLLVRQLLAAAGGEPWPAVLRRELFDPLALAHTWVPTDADLPRLSFGPSPYLAEGAVPGEVQARYRLGWIATGVIASTAGEVARFYHALFAGDLLSPGMGAALREAIPLPEVPGRPWRQPGYGLGVQVDLAARGGPCWGHTGAGPGASASACHRPHPLHPVTVVVLTDGEDVPQAEWMSVAMLDAAT
jgi:D-alanyl-D-alanine carboxypeptidase